MSWRALARMPATSTSNAPPLRDDDWAWVVCCISLAPCSDEGKTMVAPMGRRQPSVSAVPCPRCVQTLLEARRTGSATCVNYLLIAAMADDVICNGCTLSNHEITEHLRLLRLQRRQPSRLCRRRARTGARAGATRHRPGLR